jgi:hypothetical protein
MDQIQSLVDFKKEFNAIAKQEYNFIIPDNGEEYVEEYYIFNSHKNTLDYKEHLQKIKQSFFEEVTNLLEKSGNKITAFLLLDNLQNEIKHLKSKIIISDDGKQFEIEGLKIKKSKKNVVKESFFKKTPDFSKEIIKKKIISKGKISKKTHENPKDFFFTEVEPDNITKINALSDFVQQLHITSDSINASLKKVYKYVEKIPASELFKEEKHSDFHWMKDKVDLMELIIAIYKLKRIHNSKGAAEQKDLMAFFGKALNIDLSGYNSLISKTNRKEHFLYALFQAYNQYKDHDKSLFKKDFPEY